MVAAVPRTHTEGSLQTITDWMAHCIGFEPSYGGAEFGGNRNKQKESDEPDSRSEHWQPEI